MSDKVINYEVGCAEPRVSVVIPCYNAERYIDKTLAALGAQTLIDLEIICVDDGSTDNTLEVIKRCALTDPRVKVLHQENEGAGSARNAGLSMAKGVWIAFLDADDVYRPAFLEKMVSSGEKGDSELVVCDFDCFIDGTEEVKPLYRVPANVTGDSLRTKDYAKQLFQLTEPQPSNKLFKLNYIREICLQFQALPNCNDFFFTFAALAGATRVAIVREPLAAYRISAGTSIQDEFAKRPTKEKCLCVYKALTELRAFCLRYNLLNQEVSKSFEVLATFHSIAATYRSLGHNELFEEVYDFYQNALLNEWHVSEPEKTYGFETRLKYELMANSTATQFAWVYEAIGRPRNRGITRKVLLGVKGLLVFGWNKLAKARQQRSSCDVG